MNKTNKKITKPKDTITETKVSKRVQGKIWSVVLEEANKKRNTGITEKDLKKRLRFIHFVSLSFQVRSVLLQSVRSIHYYLHNF